MRKRTREIEAEALAELRHAGAKASNADVRWRVTIVLAYFEGRTYEQIIREHRTSSRTIAKWIERYREEGLEGLRDRPKPGRPPTVREPLDAWLPKVIHQSPRTLGIERDQWTLQTLQEECERQTGLRPALESIRLALERLGQRWKRAKRTITSPDPEYEAKRGHC